MNAQALTPTRLRLILAAAMLLVVALGIGVFVFGYKQISAFADADRQAAVDAQTSNSSLQTLTATKQQLEDQADAVTRASQLVAESKSYQYQDQIISDINKYASEAGLSITNIAFDAGAVSTATTSTPSATTTPAAGAPAGVKSVSATLTLKNPTSYDSVIKFLHLIEQSLFRMQISKVGIARSDDTHGDSDKVTTETLTIEVYVR